MSRVRSARRANERRRAEAARKQTPLPMEDLVDEFGDVLVQGQMSRARERAAAHAARYPVAPTYQSRPLNPRPIRRRDMRDFTPEAAIALLATRLRGK